MTNFKEQLERIIHSDTMRNYEEVNMAYISTLLIKLNQYKYKLIIRSDRINEMTYWSIRYFRSRKVYPSAILSTQENKSKMGSIQNVRIITIDDLKFDNTQDCFLIIVNRESDYNKNLVNDYRESDYGFLLRSRLNLQYINMRGVENYYYILKNEDKYYPLLDELADDESRNTFVEIIRCLIENDVYKEKEHPSSYKYFDKNIYKPMEGGEDWINFGSCTGDTILHYLCLGNHVKKIYAVEMDKAILEKLKNVLELLPIHMSENIQILDRQFGGIDDFYNIDKEFANKKVSLINMDIEGAELLVLSGALETIKRDLPVLAIAAYHKAEDLLEIPKFIKKINSDYVLYLRKYVGYAPDAVNEYIYYAVPSTRINNCKG